jgi:hypothetical protein
MTQPSSFSADQREADAGVAVRDGNPPITHDNRLVPRLTGTMITISVGPTGLTVQPSIENA